MAETKKEIAKPTPVMEKTFPFSETDKIEVLSYPMRMYWDVIKINGEEHINKDVVLNKKLNISDLTHVKERVYLNDYQKEKLFNILFIKECEPDAEAAACYSPRHLVLFYNDKQEIISNIEMCLECSVWMSKDFGYSGHVPSCKSSSVSSIFKQAGIKYFGEGE